MSQAQRTKIQALLAADQSPLRDELLGLVFDAIAAEPLSGLIADPALVPTIFSALSEENARRIARRHVLPGIARIDAGFTGQPQRLRDGLSAAALEKLRAVVHSGKGPRFGWLAGAVDPNDIRQLVAPVVQQVLIQFTTKLPIPGLGGGNGGSGGGGGGGGLLGMIGKSVQRSAGQLADVGKSVMSGLGSELEKRIQQMTRDFSQTAVTDFRAALLTRMRTPEGKQIVERIRERVLERVLDGKLDVVMKDFLHLPTDDISEVVVGVIGHLPSQPWFRAAVEGEVAAVLHEIGKRSLAELLSENGLLAEARGITLRAFTPGIKQLAASDAFGGWVERLLDESSKP